MRFLSEFNEWNEINESTTIIFFGSQHRFSPMSISALLLDSLLPHASQSLPFEKRFLEKPFAGRCEPDIQSFMEDLKPLALQAAKRMVEMLGAQIGSKAMAKAR